jgi:hypothetical protein
MPHERPHHDGRTSEPVTIASPAVATGFTHTFPKSEVTRVVSVSFVLVADGNAANRICRVEYLKTEGIVFFAVAAPFTVTAGVTSRLNFGIGVQQFGANAAAQIGAALPDFELQGGCSVRVAVTAVQAGDQISAASLFVDQWPVRVDDGG